MGRGSSGGGDSLKGGGADKANIKNVRDLVSMRESKRQEVDEVLTVAQYMHDEYGMDVEKFVVADLSGKDALTMAYYDGENIGFNSKYFNSEKMTKAYDSCAADGFHPGRGDKTAMEAIGAHEYGHAIIGQVAGALTMSGHASDATSVDKVTKYVVNQALKKTKQKSATKFARNISGYATYNNGECISEAFSDVYCNGSKAKAESRAIVSVINDILGKK